MCVFAFASSDNWTSESQYKESRGLSAHTLSHRRALVPFYNEHATATRVQHRTRDYRNPSEYIVMKKLQQQQIHLKLLARCLIFVLSSLIITSTKLNFKKFLLAARSHASTLYDIFFVCSSFLLHSSQLCCCCASIVGRALVDRLVHVNCGRHCVRVKQRWWGDPKLYKSFGSHIECNVLTCMWRQCFQSTDMMQICT